MGVLACDFVGLWICDLWVWYCLLYLGFVICFGVLYLDVWVGGFMRVECLLWGFLSGLDLACLLCLFTFADLCFVCVFGLHDCLFD